MADKLEKTQTKHRKLRLWHIPVMLLVVVVVGSLAVRWHWRREFRERIAAARAAGYPVTLEELDAWYEWPPAGDNAAYWIVDAASLHERPPQEDWRRLEQLVRVGGDRLDPTKPIPDDTMELLEQYVRSNAEALETLHSAATISESRYPIDLLKGPTTPIPHIGEVRHGCTLLCMEAVLLASHGDPNGAAEAIAAALSVAGSLDQEPVPISHLVRMGGAAWAASTLERTLHQAAFTDAQLEMLYRAFSDIHADDGLLRSLAGEQCGMLSVFERPWAIDSSFFHKPPPLPVLQAYAALGLSAREGTIFLDHMAECIRIVQLPTFERLAAVQAAEANFRGRRGLLVNVSEHVPSLISREVRTIAQIETAKTALGVERYRLMQGMLPETLAPLVPRYLPKIPPDPFDGRSLRYKQIERGFVVYSVGEDGADDGGKEPPPPGKTRESWETYDIVFRIDR